MLFSPAKTGFAASCSTLKYRIGAGGDIPLENRIQILQVDHGGEFLNYETEAMLPSKGVRQPLARRNTTASSIGGKGAYAVWFGQY